MKKKRQNGQSLLIVVLVMVVSLTIALSAASRSIVNLRNTTEEENSQRAFSAAEAGVERALRTGVNITGAPVMENKARIESVTVSTSQGTEILVRGGNTVPKDDGADIWLSRYPDYTSPWSGNLTISWGVVGKDPCTDAALEVIVLSGSRGSPVSTRYAFDSCSSRNNQFSSGVVGTHTIKGKNFRVKTTQITVSSGLVARVVPLYANTPIAVTGSSALPAQGKEITSIGRAGETTRKITYFQGFPELPVELFPYIIFSP